MIKRLSSGIVKYCHHKADFDRLKTEVDILKPSSVTRMKTDSPMTLSVIIMASDKFSEGQ